MTSFWWHHQITSNTSSKWRVQI